MSQVLAFPSQQISAEQLVAQILHACPSLAVHRASLLTGLAPLMKLPTFTVTVHLPALSPQDEQVVRAEICRVANAYALEAMKPVLVALVERAR